MVEERRARLAHERVKLSPMRAAIARRMSDSKRKAPHFYVSAELEMDAVKGAVERANRQRAPDERHTITAYLVRAVAESLTHFPTLNAVWTEEGLELIQLINVGVAIALDDGLVAPALLDVTSADVDQLSTMLRDLTTRARAGKLRGPEVTDGTFTLTNLGMFDVSSFIAIITPPQVATLATGRVVQKPVFADGRLEPRWMMTATVSADHRAVDGALVARFLGDLGDGLRRPAEWAARTQASRQ